MIACAKRRSVSRSSGIGATIGAPVMPRYCAKSSERTSPVAMAAFSVSAVVKKPRQAGTPASRAFFR